MNPFDHPDYPRLIAEQAHNRVAYERAKQECKRKRQIIIEQRQKAIVLRMLEIEQAA